MINHVQKVFPHVHKYDYHFEIWQKMQKRKKKGGISSLIPANIYLFKVDNRNTRKRGENCSKLTKKTPKQHRSSLRKEKPLSIFAKKLRRRC